MVMSLDDFWMRAALTGMAEATEKEAGRSLSAPNPAGDVEIIRRAIDPSTPTGRAALDALSRLEHWITSRC